MYIQYNGNNGNGKEIGKTIWKWTKKAIFPAAFIAGVAGLAYELCGGKAEDSDVETEDSDVETEEIDDTDFEEVE